MNEGDARAVRGYDRLAPIYQSLEWCLFGPQLQRARMALLEEVPCVERAVVLGDGDGRLLEQLARRRLARKIVSVDQSPEMLQRQRSRLARNAESTCDVDFICRDARLVTAPGPRCGLLVCSFFLDCFPPETLADCLPGWLGMLHPDGLLYVVDFRRPARGWRRWQADAVLWLMHRFFRWQTDLPNRTLVDLDDALARQPLELVRAADELHPMMMCRLYRRRSGP